MTSRPKPVALHYADEGAGPPILLVHGWTCDLLDWSFQFAALGAQYRVVAADLRGHGRSPVPGGGYEPRQFADDLAALIRRLDCGAVVAVGHSIGGLAVASLAVEHADLVAATVGVDPAYGVDAVQGEGLDETMAGLQSADPNEVAIRALAAVEGVTPPWLREWHRHRTLGTPADVVRDTFYGTYFRDDQFGRRSQTETYLQGRRCPHLSIHRLPEVGHWETSILRQPHSRTVEWEGVGHWLHQVRCDEFNAILLEWLAELPAWG